MAFKGFKTPIKSGFWDFIEQNIDELFGILILFSQEVGRVFIVSFHNQLINLIRIFLFFSKRNIPTLKFKHTNSKSPNIHSISVPFALNNLGSHIMRSAKYGKCSMVVFQNFGRPQIYQMQVPILINHDIFWFEVSIDDVVFM